MAEQLYSAWIAGPWGVGSGGANVPQLLLDYPAVLGFEDVTGQPAANVTPNPNVYTIRVTADGPTIDQIERDAAYDVLAVEPIQGEEAPV